VQTTLVNVPAIVTDAHDRYIPDLTANDFVLYEDDARQPIALFAASQEPIHVALLLDTSRSTATVLGKIKNAAAEFLSHLRPQDQAMIVSFDFEVHVLSRLKSDLQQLKEDVRRAEVASYPNTKLRDAVFEVMQESLVAVQGRKAIVLLSDGQDVGSRVSAVELIGAVGGSDTVIYPVHYRVDPKELMKKLFGISGRLPDSGDKIWRDYERQGREFLQKLADESAGRLRSSEVGDLKKTFELVTQELRHQYLLGFYPDKSKLGGNLHALRVEVTRPGAVVRARRSYRASKP
jgi:VWFA-related protein